MILCWLHAQKISFIFNIFLLEFVITTFLKKKNLSEIYKFKKKRTIILWDLKDYTFAHKFLGHSDIIMGVNFTDDKKHLLGGSWNGYTIIKKIRKIIKNKK